MAEGKKKDPLRGLGLITAFIVFFMTVGFILLASVYTGPVWVRVLVFVVYIVVVAGLVRGVRKLKKDSRPAA